MSSTAFTASRKASLATSSTGGREGFSARRTPRRGAPTSASQVRIILAASFRSAVRPSPAIQAAQSCAVIARLAAFWKRRATCGAP